MDAKVYILKCATCAVEFKVAHQGRRRCETCLPPQYGGVVPVLAQVKTLEAVESRYVLRALATLNWNRVHTARALGISLRTLRSKITDLRRQGWVIPVGRIGNPGCSLE